MLLQEIVAALPGLLLLGFSVSTGGGSSSFSRSGYGRTERSTRLPGFVSGFLERGLLQHEIPGDMLSNAFGVTRRLLNESMDKPRAFSPLLQWSWIAPRYGTSLETQAALNPFRDDYAQSTYPLYERVAQEAQSVAQSGPAFQRGAIARQGYALSDLNTQLALQRFRELYETRQRDAQMVQNAVNLLNTIEQMRAGQLMQAEQLGEGLRTQTAQTLMNAVNLLNALQGQGLNFAQLAGALLGTEVGASQEKLSGAGSQSGSTLATTCCFIFLEALNGKLPWYVRWGRYCLVNPRRRAGYRWMSRWLVPLMQRYDLVKRLVNTIMVKPFLRWGRAMYERFERRPLLALYCRAWLGLWELIGYARPSA